MIEPARPVVDPGAVPATATVDLPVILLLRAGAGDRGDDALMRVIDAAFLDMPWHGSRQMVRHLRRLRHDVVRRVYGG